MRRSFLLLLAVLASVSTAAQPRPSLTDGQEAVLYGIPVVSTLGTALLLTKADESALATGLALGLPLVAAGTTCAAGRLAVVPGSCMGALRGAVRGALPAFALLGAAYFMGRSATTSLGSPVLGLVLLGAVAYVVVPPFTAIDGYRKGASVEVAPALLAVPEAEALGLRVRLGL